MDNEPIHGYWFRRPSAHHTPASNPESGATPTTSGNPAASRCSSQPLPRAGSSTTASSSPAAVTTLEKRPKIQREPSSRWTPHQIFYLLGMHGLGAMLISGGINFAIACAMYLPTDDEVNPVRLWKFPNTLAGDVGVTIIIQTLITYLVETIMVRHDIRKGIVQPVGFIARPTHLPFLRRVFMLDAHARGVTPGPRRNWLNFLTHHGLVLALLVLASFLLVFGPCIGILYALGDRHREPGAWGDPFYSHKWKPQAIKGVLGAVLGLLFTPLMAGFWVVRAGWAEVVAVGDEFGGDEAAVAAQDVDKVVQLDR